MDFDFQTETITPTQTTVLTVSATGALHIPTGTAAQRPAAPLAGYTRFNTNIPSLEFYDGTVWKSSAGVTSVATAVTGTGLTVTGGPITSTGTLTFELSNELKGLSALTVNGIVARTAAGTYTNRTITGTAGNIVITDGDGVSGNPTINLATVGTAIASSLVKITTDAFGRITATAAVTSTEIINSLGYTPVNKAGDSMSLNASLTFSGTGTVTGIPLPTTSSDVANKQYVDNLVQGVDAKASVRVATTTAGTLATAFEVGDTIDGYVLVLGDRILIKNQVTAAENGIYTVNTTGLPTRALDMDAWTEVPAAFAFVEEGTVNKDTGWLSIADQGGTLGTTSIPWTQFSSLGAYSAGTGLTLTGSVFSLTTPVSVANGGTGLTTAGTANQILGTNAAGTASEYKTLTAGTGITVTQGVGTVTFANSGILTVTGTANQITAVTTTGAVVLTTPATFIAPGSVSVTTTLSKSINSAVSAAGTTQGSATSLATDNNIVTTVSAGNTGVILPLPSTPFGNEVTVRNTSVLDLLIYPNSGAAIDGGAANAAITVKSGETVAYVSSSATQWYTVNPSIIGSAGITVSNSAGVKTISNTGVTSIVAGTGVTVSGATGAVTITNAGVTSVALADISTAPIFTVTGSPVTTSGTLNLALSTQLANKVFAGPATGAAAQPTFRTLVAADMPYLLYKENPTAPTAPVVTGVNSVAIGSGSTASAIQGVAIGDGTDARVQGQKVFGNGKFATAGDAQFGIVVERGITTDATLSEIFIDGSGATQRLTIPDNSLMVFDIYVAGRRTDATGGGAGYRFNGVIKRDVGVATTVLVGSVSKTVIAETNTAWDALVTADTVNGALKIQVAGEAAKTVRWVATVQTTEVTN